jgi:hypothetical protein
MSLQMLLEMDDSDTLHADTRWNVIHRTSFLFM